ncbi:acyltransferase [Herbaspirillum rhizosphaerae]|uniref:Acyltransferase n=1 Tax=Herbaspirillum rhizosphaerae TaxID=346179 RepID=A0ABW8Z7V2_9BURK
MRTDSGIYRSGGDSFGEKIYRFLIAAKDVFDLNMPGRIDIFDGFRAIAIILVFNTHFFSTYYAQQYFADDMPVVRRLFNTLRSGDMGVDLFFILSGFLIFNILRRRSPTFSSFFGKRFARLLPAHIVLLLFMSVAPFYFGDFVANLFFVSPLFEGVKTINPVTWTLTIELLFYIIIFFVCRSLKGVGAWWLIAATGIFVLIPHNLLLWIAANVETSPSLQFFFITPAHILILGVCSAFWWAWRLLN